MKRLSDGINDLFAQQGGADSLAAKARRASVVRDRWANAVQAVYARENAADFILSHVNAVYIMDDELIVYCDDSLVRSDLDARQEFLKMALNRQGENVTRRFKILASKFNMKARHPFVAEAAAAAAKAPEASSGDPVSPHEVFTEAQADELVGQVQDETLKRALKRAILADLNK